MVRPAGSDESLSLWIDTTPSTNYHALQGDVEADVAIVGAGITGITAAPERYFFLPTALLNLAGNCAMSPSVSASATISMCVMASS